MNYQHFTIEEREKIQELLWQKSSIRHIAATLGRSPSSVSRELKRNYHLARKQYVPRASHERALAYRTHRGRTQRLKNDRIRTYAIAHLKQRWSPEQIAGKMKEEIGEAISYEAIYQFIYAQIHRDGWGYLNPGHEDLRSFLRRRKKRRTPKGTRRGLRCFKPKGASIDSRPQIVESRRRLGDWESDSMESIDHKPGINTLVERKSGLVLITRLTDKSAGATAAAITNRLKLFGEEVKRTITFDNGPENSDWQSVEEQTGVKTFFAHPYHSWERGTNENTNGLIRDYFPKKTDFDTISDEELAFVEGQLNTRPRKRLGWLNPINVMGVALEG